MGYMALFGSIATVRMQTRPDAVFAVAWAYVDALTTVGSAVNHRVASLRPGESQKHELAGGVFVIEQAYETKPRAEGFFESHRKYVDVQVVVDGDERMEVADLARATVRQPYQEERDLIVYEDVADASALRLHAGEVAVFHPADVHMPSLRAGAGPVVVRKAVLKLPVAVAAPASRAAVTG